MQELVRVSKALSDETRLWMLKLLTEKDICVCEMHDIFQISHSQISRNLKTLMDAGFLKRWHEGKCVVYEADKDASNRYCRAVLEILVDSFNDSEPMLRNRTKLHTAIEDGIREEKKR